MKKIGLFCATKAERTSWAAEDSEIGEDKIEVVAIEQAWQNDFTAYDCFYCWSFHVFWTVRLPLIAG